MSEIRKFYESLSPTEGDRFAAVMLRLNQESSAMQLEKLEAELAGVKQRLDGINAYRSDLRSRRDELKSVITKLDDQIATGCGTELVQLRLVLLHEDAKLEELFASTRPDELHEKKARLRKEIAERKLLGRLTGMILAAARKADGCH